MGYHCTKNQQSMRIRGRVIFQHGHIDEGHKIAYFGANVQSVSSELDGLVCDFSPMPFETYTV